MILRHDSPVVQLVSRFLIPLIQLFALYVLFHGHYSPGGGFQAGVLIGASIILQMLAGTGKGTPQFSVDQELKLATLGLGIYFFIGLLPVFYGSEFLNYGAILFLSDEQSLRRYYSILIAEIGVTLVVSMTLVIIFQILAFLPAPRNKR